ncbi:MAG: hypothetical protein P1V97_21040 [Planctomycetota bacterium]|nr:hypothetical protein [Planctomycetota bacterium]
MCHSLDTQKNTKFPPWLPLVILVSAAFFTRLIVSNLTAIIYPDGAIYLEMARDIAEGNWTLALRRIFHPAFPAVIALVYSLSGLSLEAAGFLTANILGALIIVPVYKSAARLADMRGDKSLRVPVVASLLAIFHDSLAVNSSQVLAYSFSQLAVASAFAFSLAAILKNEDRKKSLFASGIAIGFAYLARPDGLLMMTGLGLSSVFVGFSNPGTVLHKLRSAILYGAIFSLGALAISSPYMTWVSVESGRFRLTLKKDPEAWVRGQSGDRTEAKRLQALRLSILNHDKENSDKPRIKSIGSSLATALKQNIKGMSWQLLAGLILCLIAMRKERRLFFTLFPGLLLLLGHIFLHYHAGYLSRRHASYQAALYLPMAALGWFFIVDQARSRVEFLNARSIYLCLGPIFLALTLPYGIRSFRPHLAHKSIARDLGQWIRENDSSASRLVVIGDEVRVVAFYAGADFIDLEQAHSEKSRIDEARLSGSAYYVLYLRTRKREMNPSIPRQLEELGAKVLTKRLATRRDIHYHWWVLRLHPVSGKRRPK